jgi:hypothetical protein
VSSTATPSKPAATQGKSLYFRLLIPATRWIQFLKTPKPPHNHDTGSGSVDYGEYVAYEGCAHTKQGHEILVTIGFKFCATAASPVGDQYFETRSKQLGWDFSFPVDAPVLTPIHQVRGVRNIIERTRHMTLDEMERSLSGFHYWVATTTWHWLCFRISSRSQEAYWNKHGHEKTVQRINRFRAKFQLEPMKG